MPERLSLVIACHGLSRCSIPPLLSSLEGSGLDREVRVRLVHSSGGLLSLAGALAGAAAEEASRVEVVAVCMGFMTPMVGEALEVAKRVREAAPGVVLVAGGPHPTGDPEGTIRVLGFDCVVVGEGERAFPQLVEELLSRGACRRVLRGDRADLDSSRPYSLGHRLAAPAIEIMRGCPHGCKYCQNPRIMGFRPRYRSVESIVECVEVLVREFGRRDVRFVAPNGFAYGSRDGRTPDPSRLGDMLEAVRAVEGVRNVFLGTFPSEVRPESVTPEVLEVVRRHVSNRRLAIGIQCGSDRVLEAIRRGHTVEEGLRAVECARRYGFQPYVDLMFGLPGEREEDMLETLRLARRLARMGARVRLHTYMPLPGTPLWEAGWAEIPPSILEAMDELARRGLADGYYREQLEAREVIRWYQGLARGNR